MPNHIDHPLDALEQLDNATVATIKAGDRVLVHITTELDDEQADNIMAQLEEGFPGVFFRILAAPGAVIVQRDGEDVHESDAALAAIARVRELAGEMQREQGQSWNAISGRRVLNALNPVEET